MAFIPFRSGLVTVSAKMWSIRFESNWSRTYSNFHWNRRELDSFSFFRFFVVVFGFYRYFYQIMNEKQ